MTEGKKSVVKFLTLKILLFPS